MERGILSACARVGGKMEASQNWRHEAKDRHTGALARSA